MEKPEASPPEKKIRKISELSSAERKLHGVGSGGRNNLDTQIEYPSSGKNNNKTNRLNYQKYFFHSKRNDSKINLENDFNATKDTNEQNINIILPLNELITFISDNFICKKCRCKTKFNVTHKQIGIASFLSFFCNKCEKSYAISNPRNNIENDKKITAYSTKHNDYDINIKFLLALQCIGGGKSEAAIISAFLNLGCNVFKTYFTSLEESLAVTERKLGKEQIQKNLEYEISLSPKDELGLTMLSTCMDSTWRKRAIGFKMDSDSGLADVFGQQSSKIIACHPMSRVCIKCKKSKSGKCEDCTYCPRNYEGSAKGMESIGALKNVLSIWENSEKKAYVANWTADEDSSSTAILKWNYKEARDIKKIPWPLNHKGKKKPNYGKLPITYPVQPEKKNDGNHAINAFCKPIFAMARGKGTKKEKPCMADARRLKRNLQYAYKQNRLEGPEVLKKSFITGLNHHFGEHNDCGLWCPVKNNELSKHNDISKLLKYRNKKNDKIIYEKIKKKYDEHLTDEWVGKLCHKYDSQKCESFHFLLSIFLPKYKYYCSTIIEQGRTYLAIIIHSIGWEKTFLLLFEQLRISNIGYYLIKYVKSRDRIIHLNRIRKDTKEYKKKKSEKNNMKIKEENLFIVKENKKGIVYGKGVERKMDDLGADKKCEGKTGKRKSGDDNNLTSVRHKPEGTLTKVSEKRWKKSGPLIVFFLLGQKMI